MERAFSERMAVTGDATYAAEKAGYGSPQVRGSQLMAKPAIKAEVLRRAETILRDEILPLALERHKMLLQATNIPAGAQLGAVALAYKQTLGDGEGQALEKEPSEMTYDELQHSIERLRREADSRGEDAKDITPESGVFD